MYMAEWDGAGAPDTYVDEQTGVLHNKFGIRDPEELRRQQAESVGSRAMELLEQPVPSWVTRQERLQQIHAYLFQDVYAWAGQLRTISMRIPAGTDPVLDGSADGARYAQPGEISGQLTGSPMNIGGAQDEFVGQCVKLYQQAHYARPFRVGNDTTLRYFLGEVARGSGRRLDLTDVISLDRDRARFVAMRPGGRWFEHGSSAAHAMFGRAVPDMYVIPDLRRRAGRGQEIARLDIGPRPGKDGRAGGGPPPGRGGLGR